MPEPKENKNPEWFHDVYLATNLCWSRRGEQRVGSALKSRRLHWQLEVRSLPRTQPGGCAEGARHEGKLVRHGIGRDQ